MPGGCPCRGHRSSQVTVPGGGTAASNADGASKLNSQAAPVPAVDPADDRWVSVFLRKMQGYTRRRYRQSKGHLHRREVARTRGAQMPLRCGNPFPTALRPTLQQQARHLETMPADIAGLEAEIAGLNQTLQQKQGALSGAKAGPEKDALKDEINELDDVIHEKNTELKKALKLKKLQDGEEGIANEDEMEDDFFGAEGTDLPEALGKFADSDEEAEQKKMQKKAAVAKQMQDNDPEARLAKELTATKAELELANQGWAKDTKALAELREMMKDSEGSRESGDMAKAAELQQLQVSYQTLEEESKKTNDELAEVTHVYVFAQHISHGDTHTFFNFCRSLRSWQPRRTSSVSLRKRETTRHKETYKPCCRRPSWMLKSSRSSYQRLRLSSVALRARLRKRKKPQQVLPVAPTPWKRSTPSARGRLMPCRWSCRCSKRNLVAQKRVRQGMLQKCHPCRKNSMHASLN